MRSLFTTFLLETSIPWPSKNGWYSEQLGTISVFVKGRLGCHHRKRVQKVSNKGCGERFTDGYKIREESGITKKPRLTD